MTKPVNKPFSMRLPDGIRAELQALAQSKGLTESDLGRMLLIEKLAEAKSAAKGAEGRTLAALIIAALSETIDFDFEFARGEHLLCEGKRAKKPRDDAARVVEARPGRAFGESSATARKECCTRLRQDLSYG